jgi:hypothetical protein
MRRLLPAFMLPAAGAAKRSNRGQNALVGSIFSSFVTEAKPRQPCPRDSDPHRDRDIRIRIFLYFQFRTRC